MNFLKLTDEQIERRQAVRQEKIRLRQLWLAERERRQVQNDRE
jgi:hypothetical protein